MPCVFLGYFGGITWIGCSLVDSVIGVYVVAFRCSGLHLSVSLTIRQVSRLCLLVCLNIYDDGFGALKVCRTSDDLVLGALVLRCS